jgi:uncharacterized protein (TIGR02217 family)
MSTAVFPVLTGLGWDAPRTPIWNNTLQENVSGKETRLALWTYPRWQWDLTFDVLRQGTVHGAAYTEFSQLAGFFNQRQGQFDTFLYTDTDDNSVTTQSIGSGDGSTTAFQLVRTFGGFVEPVLAPNAVSAVYLAGVAIPTAGLSAPTNGALTATAAGALGATTYYVKTTWTTASGETLPSVETNLAVLANKVLNVAAPGSAPTGATGWNVYVSNTAGGGSGTETKQNGGTPIALGTPWVEPTGGLVAGAALPGANTTGWTFSSWGSATPGVLTFAGVVANATAITADFTYYWPVRFVDNQITFNKFMAALYAGKKVSLKSVKN